MTSPARDRAAAVDFQPGYRARRDVGSCGASPELPNVVVLRPRRRIELVADDADRLQFCGCDTQACVADALDDYANALEKAVEPAPPVPGGPPVQARKLPRVVRELRASSTRRRRG